MMSSIASSMQSILWLRIKILIQFMDQRRHRRTKLFVVQLVLLLAASIVYYQRTFFATNPSESSATSTKSSDVVVQETIRPPKHWTLKAYKKGNKVDCQISTTPVESTSSTNPKSEQFTIDSDKEQYVLHIHGLHHSGTGYLRQTLHDALNEAFSNKSGSNDTVASMQDSLRPYQQLLDEVRGDKRKRMKLQKRFYKPEDEGQHLQSIYPSFAMRYTKMKKVKGPNKFSRLSYIADLCHIIDSNNNPDDKGNSLKGDNAAPDIDKYKLLGHALFQQWSQYWDTSAMFLLQKSPMLDLLFLEKTKIFPTLHVIVVRHPMTSNSWGASYMSHLWLSSWTHAFEALADQKIEWYAVVTYEALISHHGQVVEELLEVVRSGMGRFQNRRKPTVATNVEHDTAEKTITTLRYVDDDTRRRSSQRRLELHGNKSNITQSSPNSYLVPKSRSINLWKECLDQTKCNQILTRLTKDIFPHLGYVNDDGRPLRKSPSTVTVRNEYGRVLFTSEGMSLNKLRQASRAGILKKKAAPPHIDYVPSYELISKMKEALK